MSNPSLYSRIYGGLLGGAIGDALGAPFECLNLSQIREIFPTFETFEDLEVLTQTHKDAFIEARGGDMPLGVVTDDTNLADLLLDCILENEGNATAHTFAALWPQLETPLDNPGQDQPHIRLHVLHWIEQIPLLRNRLRDIPKRELGHGEQNATNAVMYIAPVGLLCAGDPLKAELMAVDVCAVNKHGRPRDVAGGYAAALAACFVPGISVEEIVRLGLAHTGDELQVMQMQTMLDLTAKCRDCDEFIERYYDEIVGHLIPMQDWQHTGSRYFVTWNSAEVLGPTLATFLLTQGKDAREMMRACAKIGRDADTIARCAGGLIGAWLGADALPREWADYVVPRNRWLRIEEKARRLTALVEANLRREVQVRQQILAP